MKLTICNWDKYNPKRDQKSYSWLRLNNDIGTQADLFGMTAEMKYIWILLLCEASKENSGDLEINLDFLSFIAQIDTKVVEKAINHLELVNKVACDRALPRTTPDTTPTNERTNVTDERTNDLCSEKSELDFESIYFKYPARVNKGVGIKKLKAKIKTQKRFDEFERSFKNYMQQLRETGHTAKNWDTFCNQWESFLTKNGWEAPQGKFELENGSFNKAQAVQDQGMEFLNKLDQRRQEINNPQEDQQR